MFVLSPPRVKFDDPANKHMGFVSFFQKIYFAMHESEFSWIDLGLER